MGNNFERVLVGLGGLGTAAGDAMGMAVGCGVDEKYEDTDGNGLKPSLSACEPNGALYWTIGLKGVVSSDPGRMLECPLYLGLVLGSSSPPLPPLRPPPPSVTSNEY